MSRRSFFLGLLTSAVLSLGTPLGAPGLARADTPRDAADRAHASAERTRLRGQLDLLNAEIDALKRRKRGLREDYELRGKMADAEALARRVTALDAKLGPPAPRAGETAPDTTWPAAPRITPSDDRGDLEAKADILADQSRELSRRADTLGRRISDLQARQELRRRAGQLERDPFSPLEQAKRRVAISAGGTSKDTPPARSGAGDLATPTQGGGTSAPSVTGPAGKTPTDSTGATSTVGATAQPPVPLPGSIDPSGSVAAQFRGILDPATLAEIRRLEAAGAASGNVAAWQRAASALRERAAQLATDANACAPNLARPAESAMRWSRLRRRCAVLRRPCSA